MTSNHHAPYGLGYTRATMAGTKSCKTVKSSESQKASLSSDCSLQLDYMIDTIGAGLTYDQEPTNSPDLAHYDALSELKLGELFADAILNKEEVILDD